MLHELSEESEKPDTNWNIVKTFFFKKVEALFLLEKNTMG